MSDLVKRLRDIPEGDQRPLYYDTMEEAADEIERLREALTGLVVAVNLRSLRGRSHVPSMRAEQEAVSVARKALSQPQEMGVSE